MKLLKKNFINKFIMKKNSMRSIINFSYTVIIILLIIPTIIIGFNSTLTSSRYNSIIDNINSASSLSDFLKSEIGEKSWDVVAGKISFEKANLSSIIDGIDLKLDYLYENASSQENKENINIIRRPVETLRMYTNVLKNQIINKDKVENTIDTNNQILSVSQGIQDLLSVFISNEIESASIINKNLQVTQQNFMILGAVILIASIVFAFYTVKSLMVYVETPIKELERFAQEISIGNFKYKVKSPILIELNPLTDSLNVMSIKLEEFIKDQIEYQKSLKKAEFQVLQAQINPHFLYNTLDTIVWLSEEEKYKEVINVTRALSDFFRVSLSKGSDFVNVEQELKHAKSYLTIQKIRYRDILNFEIIEDENLKTEGILKLLLQPLIENALYHGIKGTRRGGNIKVIGKKDHDFMYFEVSDDGAGIKEDLLLELNENLSKLPDKNIKNYGLYNVNKRLMIYYGENYKLNIESTFNEGTKVFFRIPLEMKEE